MIRKFTRRLTSLSDAARRYWAEAPARPRATLGVDAFEDRVVPTVAAANVVLAGNVLTITNAAAGTDTVTLSQTGADQITVVGAVNGALGAFNGVRSIAVVNNDAVGANQFNLTTTTDLNTTSLRQITYTGTDNGAGDFVDLAGFLNGAAATVTNANLYTSVDLKGANPASFDGFDTPAAGVAVVVFRDTAVTNSTTFLDNSKATANTFIGFDFRAVTSGVQVNLNANVNSQVASYTNQSVQLINGANAARVIAVYGGSGNDSLIGNDQGNLLIGGGGNDTLIGNGGADQLNATRDFSPAIAGTVTNGVAATTSTTVVDLTQFTTASTQVTSANGTSTGGTVASALYAAFGRFNFGEGAAFLNNAVNATGLGADFTTANGIQVANATQDQLFGNDGNDGLYGFNNTASTSFGGAGNDVVSSNTLALAATLDGGDNDDLLIGGITGFTLQGQGGVDTFQFAPGTPSAVNTVIGGAGNDIFQTAIPRVTLDASQDTDTFSNPTTNVGIVNDASVIITTNASTVITLSALPLVQKTTR